MPDTDWSEPNAENVKALIEALRTIPRRQLSQEKLALELDWSPSQVSRFLAGKLSWESLKKVHFLRAVEIARDLDGKNYLAGGAPASPERMEYKGLSSFFGMNRNNFEFALNNIRGTYTSLRPSFRLKGKNGILRGLLEINFSGDKGGIVAHELYRIQGNSIFNEGSDIFFERKGYLTYRDGKAEILCKKTDGSGDVETVYLRELLPDGGGPTPSRINMMKGIVSDWQRESFYVTSIYLRRESAGSLSIKKAAKDPQYLKAFSDSDPEIVGQLSDIYKIFRNKNGHMFWLSSEIDSEK